jgi:hypothetical protein
VYVKPLYIISNVTDTRGARGSKTNKILSTKQIFSMNKNKCPPLFNSSSYLPNISLYIYLVGTADRNVIVDFPRSNEEETNIFVSKSETIN